MVDPRQKKLLAEIMEADAKDGLYHIGDTNKMMTAVEWLIHQLNTRQKPLDNSQIDELFEQAIAMEKQQMKDAVIYGLDEDGHTGDWKISVAQKYYNEKHLGIKGLSD